MRQVREVLRLKHVAGHSERRIAAAIGISRYTVAEYLRRAMVVGITWPVPSELDDSALEARLFSPAFAVRESPRPQLDWPRLHAELRRAGVTLLLLWEEYRTGQPDGYGYSRFCDLYRDWRVGISPTMRQTHVAGERMFVDFAGQTVPITDPFTGARCDRRKTMSLPSARRITPTLKRAGRRGWGGLDRLPRQCAWFLRRYHAPDRLRQSQGRFHRRVSLRAGDQPDLPGERRPRGTAIVPTRVRKPRDKAKSRSPSRWWSDGGWGGSATVGSSRLANSTPLSAN